MKFNLINTEDKGAIIFINQQAQSLNLLTGMIGYGLEIIDYVKY